MNCSLPSIKKSIKKGSLLEGLGELVDKETKTFVKNKLQNKKKL